MFDSRICFALWPVRATKFDGRYLVDDGMIWMKPYVLHRTFHGDLIRTRLP